MSSCAALGSADQYTYAYNLADQLTQVTNPATGQTGTGNSYTLNTYLYPGGPLTESQLYDESNMLQRTESYGYGPEGELLGKGGDELNQTYTYNVSYQLASVEDGLSQTTSYTYNELGFRRCPKSSGKLNLKWTPFQS